MEKLSHETVSQDISFACMIPHMWVPYVVREKFHEIVFMLIGGGGESLAVVPLFNYGACLFFMEKNRVIDLFIKKSPTYCSKLPLLWGMGLQQLSNLLNLKK